MSNSDSQSGSLIGVVNETDNKVAQKPKFLVGYDDSDVSDTEDDIPEVEEDQLLDAGIDSPSLPPPPEEALKSSASNLAGLEAEALEVESSPAGSGSPAKKLDEIDPALQPSHSEGELSQKSKSGKTPTRGILTADLSIAQLPVQPADIIEYEWPHKSGERYFIQEQICQMLNINSFKRKHPEMSRRTIEPKERDYLIRECGFVTTLPSTLLTALQADEVHEFISADFPDIYAEYQKACAEKVKIKMMEKQKELELIKLDAKKMEELRTKAIKSAAEFNGELQSIKRAERQQFWDIQTNIIQSPLNKWLRMAPEYTRPSNYPVFLLPGQYTEHFKRFDAAALRRLPLGTVMENDDLFPPRRDPSPPPIRVSDVELENAQRKEREESAAMADNEDSLMEKPPPTASFKLIKQELIAESVSNSPASKSPRPRRNSSDAPPPAKMRRTSASVSRKNARSPAVAPSPKQPAAAPAPVCTNCGSSQAPQSTARFVRCSTCQQQMHSCCVEMPPEMVDVVLGYDWCCINCKNCSVCGQPDQEEAMMCCDSCDRGYHTFCIGLSKTPNGVWHCVKCVEPSPAPEAASTSAKTQAKNELKA